MVFLKKTPEVLPWLPPGQTKETTFNRFAHKKGSIASQLNAEVAKKRSESRKHKDNGVAQILSLTDSGRVESFTTFDRQPKESIIRIFEEEELAYYSDEEEEEGLDDRDTRDSGMGSLGDEKRRHSSERRRKSRKEKRRRSEGDVSSSRDERISSRERKTLKQLGLKDKVSDYLDEDGRIMSRETRSDRSREGKRDKQDKVESGIASESHRSSIGSPNSNRSRDSGPDKHLNQSFQSRSIDFISPRALQQQQLQQQQLMHQQLMQQQQLIQQQQQQLLSNQQQLYGGQQDHHFGGQPDSLDVGRPRQGEMPEAWLVFPNDRLGPGGRGSRMTDYPSPRGYPGGYQGDYPSPRGGPPGYHNNMDFPSPRAGPPGRISRISHPVNHEPVEVGVAKAVPVNFSSSIGSRLQASFRKINGRSSPTTQTPVETFREEDDDELLVNEKEEAEKPFWKRLPTWVWALLICLLIVVIVGLIVGVTFAILNSGSSSLTASKEIGPGDNSPCKNYVALTEKWRKIIGKGPAETGSRYYCDNTLEENQWYRFDGEAGERLADQSEPPSWEECGTSRVGWLAGNHPEISDGTVNRTMCITAFDGNCEVKMIGKVRACADSRGGLFFSYLLQKPRIGCNWAYCAVGG